MISMNMYFMLTLCVNEPHNIWLKSNSGYVSFESHVKQLCRRKVQTGV